MTPEGKVKKQVLNWLRDNGYYAFPVQDRFRHGTLDIFATCPQGRGMWLEIKRPIGGKVSPLQEKEIDNLRRHHFKAGVVRGIDDLKKLIEEDLNGMASFHRP